MKTHYKQVNSLIPLLITSNGSVQIEHKTSLQCYLNEIHSYQVLSREKIEELAKRFQENGDQQARQAMVLGNLRLVVKIASDYKSHWSSNFTDLIQEGNLGLLLATKKFDPDRGVKFSYYAAYWIRAYILKFISDNWRLVKICTTQTMRNLFHNLNKEKKKLELCGEAPDIKKLAKSLSVSESDVIDADQRINNSDISTDLPVGDTGNMLFVDTLPQKDETVEDLTEKQDLHKRVRIILEQLRCDLPLREETILNERIMAESPRTLQSIAAEINLSKERVRQIELKLHKKIRSSVQKEMPDYSFE